MPRFSEHLLINASFNKKLCVFSYNSRGFGKEKEAFCNFLLSNKFVGDKIPILCNQEHFILRGNCYRIEQAFPQCHTLIKPAMKENFDNGRARNGMFIAVPKVLINKPLDVSPLHWRVQAALLTCMNSKILIINTYFPVDDRNSKNCESTELVEVLEVIKSIVHKYAHDKLLLLGDINANFSRRSPHCLYVVNFI